MVLKQISNPETQEVLFQTLCRSGFEVFLVNTSPRILQLETMKLSYWVISALPGLP